MRRRRHGVFVNEPTVRVAFDGTCFHPALTKQDVFFIFFSSQISSPTSDACAEKTVCGFILLTSQSEAGAKLRFVPVTKDRISQWPKPCIGHALKSR